MLICQFINQRSAASSHGLTEPSRQFDRFDDIKEHEKN